MISEIQQNRRECTEPRPNYQMTLLVRFGYETSKGLLLSSRQLLSENRFQNAAVQTDDRPREWILVREQKRMSAGGLDPFQKGLSAKIVLAREDPQSIGREDRKERVKRPNV